MLPQKVLRIPKIPRDHPPVQVTWCLARLCQAHQIPLRAEQPDNGGRGRQWRDEVAWAHFHAILETLQLTGRPQCHGRKFRQQLPERDQPPGQRFSRRLEHVREWNGSLQSRTLLIASAVAPSAGRRTRARHRGRAPASARKNRRLTCISSRAVSPSNARISSRFTVTATAFGARVRLDLAPAREVVRSLAVDVLR